MFGAAASPVGWNWNLVSRDQGVLVATVGLPVGLDDTVLSGGPIGLGRGLLAGRSVLDGVVPPFGVLATDGKRFAAQQDWFGMASMYVYRSHGVVASQTGRSCCPTSSVTQSVRTPRDSPGTQHATPLWAAPRR